MQVNLNSDRRALYYGLCAVLLWSTVATAFKLALRELDVWQLVAYSVCFSCLALFAILWRQGRLALLPRYARETPVYFLLMGLVNPVAYYLVLLRAYDLLPAQQAQAINYTWAITLALLAVPLLGHRLNRRDALAPPQCPQRCAPEPADSAATGQPCPFRSAGCTRGRRLLQPSPVARQPGAQDELVRLRRIRVA